VFQYNLFQFVDFLEKDDYDERRHKKLLTLKSLLLKNMGNKDISEKTLITIVSIMDELQI